MTTKKTAYLLPFILVTSLFFLWGIANNLNGILIPHLRKALQLSNMQSTFVDTAVYLAYFLAAIPSGIILKKFGSKKGSSQDYSCLPLVLSFSFLQPIQEHMKYFFWASSSLDAD